MSRIDFSEGTKPRRVRSSERTRIARPSALFAILGFAVCILPSARVVRAQKNDPVDPPSVEIVETVDDDIDMNSADSSDADATEEELRVAMNVRVNVSVPEPSNSTSEGSVDRSSRHFIAEASGGLMLSPGMGGTSHLLIGAGGRRRGGFLRFYAIGGLSHSSLVRHEWVSRGSRYESSSHQLDVTMGLRIYVPLFGPLRLFTDVLGGGSHVWSSVQGETFGDRAARGWRRVFSWAIGLQVRVTRDLSVGGRLALRVAGDPLEDLREHLGDEELEKALSLGGTVSWHF